MTLTVKFMNYGSDMHKMNKKNNRRMERKLQSFV